MNSSSILSPEDQSVTFVELFFDLIFVYSVTQIVGLLHEGITWLSIGQSLIIFWLVWWAWTQFTWALNASDTTHAMIELGTLLATAVAFFMAISVPDAFQGGALWFAIPYIVSRAIGMAIYIWVAAVNPSQRTAVRNFTLASLAGLAAVLLGGLYGGTLQYLLWGSAIALDIFATVIVQQEDTWNIHPEHFSERHGLFVIIALGETLIIAAAGARGALVTPELLGVAILAVSLTCALWWSYFPRAKPVLEHGLEASEGATRTRFARDAFSVGHFLLIAGVIGIAAGIEEAVAHPDHVLPIPTRWVLAAGLVLFVGGMATAIWRATGQLPLLRSVLVLITASAVLAFGAFSPWQTLGLAFVGIAIIAIGEQLAKKDYAKK